MCGVLVHPMSLEISSFLSNVWFLLSADSKLYHDSRFGCQFETQIHSIASAGARSAAEIPGISMPQGARTALLSFRAFIGGGDDKWTHEGAEPIPMPRIIIFIGCSRMSSSHDSHRGDGHEPLPDLDGISATPLGAHPGAAYA